MKLSRLASTTVRNHTSPRPSTLAKRFETASQSLPAIKTRRSSGAGTVRSGLRLTADLQVKCSDGRLVHVSDLGPRVPLHCPYHDDRHASAFTVVRRPTGRSGARPAEGVSWPPEPMMNWQLGSDGMGVGRMSKRITTREY